MGGGGSKEEEGSGQWRGVSPAPPARQADGSTDAPNAYYYYYYYYNYHVRYYYYYYYNYHVRQADGCTDAASGHDDVLMVHGAHDARMLHPLVQLRPLCGYVIPADGCSDFKGYPIMDARMLHPLEQRHRLCGCSMRCAGVMLQDA